MKKDAFENFVDDHRNEWDDKQPPAGVWAHVSRRLFGSVSLMDSVMVWRTAAMILFGLSAYLFFAQQPSVNEVKPLVGQQEFKDIEIFYSTQISEKVALLTSEGLFADDSFSQDLQKLKAMYSVLSDVMKKGPSEKVKDALVLNMLVQIDLLNQQIQRLEESKKRPAKESLI